VTDLSGPAVIATIVGGLAAAWPIATSGIGAAANLSARSRHLDTLRRGSPTVQGILTELRGKGTDVFGILPSRWTLLWSTLILLTGFAFFAVDLSWIGASALFLLTMVMASYSWRLRTGLGKILPIDEADPNSKATAKTCYARLRQIFYVYPLSTTLTAGMCVIATMSPSGLGTSFLGGIWEWGLLLLVLGLLAVVATTSWPSQLGGLLQIEDSFYTAKLNSGIPAPLVRIYYRGTLYWPDDAEGAEVKSIGGLLAVSRLSPPGEKDSFSWAEVDHVSVVKRRTTGI
jgi:hypothetical protein